MGAEPEEGKELVKLCVVVKNAVRANNNAKSGYTGPRQYGNQLSLSPSLAVLGSASGRCL